LKELKREFTKWSTVSYAISILGVLGSVPATIGVPLSEGGPGTAVWAWAIGSFMAMCIASSGKSILFGYLSHSAMVFILHECNMIETNVSCLSVAELVSAYPTAGGMYFVTKHVVPKEHVAIWAWIIGWCNFLGQAAGVASLAYSIAQMILAAVVMNTDIIDGESSFKPYVYPP
jgi:amino acid transporter